MYSTKEFTIVSLVEELTLPVGKCVSVVAPGAPPILAIRFYGFTYRHGPGGRCTMRHGDLGGLAWLSWPHFPHSLAFSHVGGHLLGAGGYCGEAGFT